MKLLITGGAGCLGSNLVEHWIPRGHEVLVLDNFATSKRETLPSVKRLTVVEGSVADLQLVNRVFRDFAPDVVIHSAAAYKDPDDWISDATTNVIGSACVAQAAKQVGARRLINFQTALCYGRAETVPIPVNHPTAPFTSYGISKTAGEQLMLISGLPALSLRIANVTGPRLSIGPIPTFYKRLKAGQSCFCSDTARDFLDISDFLTFMDLALSDSGPGGVYNIASGQAHTIKEIYEIVAQHLGLPSTEVRIVPPGPDDVPVVALDPSTTTRDFGWAAAVGFNETIRRQLQWYDRHGVSDVFSHLQEAAPASEQR